MLFVFLFFGLTMPGCCGATLGDLIDAAKIFSTTIRKQLETVEGNPSPTEFAQRTIDYAEAKAAYFKALEEEMPELAEIATGKRARPPELDKFAAAFSDTGENQEKAVDQRTRVLLNQFAGNPDVEKARTEFEAAQKVEERFQREFDSLDFSYATEHLQRYNRKLCMTG